MLTDLFNRVYSDGIPYLLSNGIEELLVYWSDVEALSPCYVVVPLVPDFGLLCYEDPLAIRPRAHWVDFNVEVEVSERLDVLLQPVTEVHEMENGVLADIHLPPGEIHIQNDISGSVERGDRFEGDEVVDLGDTIGIIRLGLACFLCLSAPFVSKVP